jgi:protein O-GlcNAc transferase
MTITVSPKVGRNELCPCGSGKKYKKCCELANSMPNTVAEPEISNDLWLALNYQQAGNHKQATIMYKRVLEVETNPEIRAQVYNNLGIALQNLNKLDEAIVSYRNALSLKPEDAATHSNLGIALQNQEKLDEAITSYKNALKLDPDIAAIHSNLGNSLRKQGKLSEAIASYENALTCQPNFVVAYSNLLHLHTCAKDISPEAQLDLASRWETIALTESERDAARKRMFGCVLRQGRKLKIGFVSAEISEAKTSGYLELLLDQLDRKRFHITLFPTASVFELRAAYLQMLVDEYKPLVGIPDNEAADGIRNDRVDILIDTTSHKSNCRLGIFARRAAAIQCELYHDYFGTTGLTEMDWMITDKPLDGSHFKEEIWRLQEMTGNALGTALEEIFDKWVGQYAWLGSIEK